MMSVDEIKDLSKKYKEQIGLPLYITGATPNTLTREKLAPLHLLLVRRLEARQCQ